MCDCCEEKERREREQARRLAIQAEWREVGEEGEGSDDEDGRGGRGRFSVLQIVLGSTGFMLALLTLLFKTMDNNTAHAILDKVGLGYLIPKIGRNCIKPVKRRCVPRPKCNPDE